MKKCFKCDVLQPIDNFYKHRQMSDGHINKCKSCNKLDVRRNYSLKKDYYKQYDQNRQRYNFSRIFNHRYASLKGRSDSRYAASSQHNYSCTNLPYLSKREFMEWCENNIEEFMTLFVVWRDSDFSRKLAPSVDRINNKLGYSYNNIRWVTQSENSQKGAS